MLRNEQVEVTFSNMALCNHIPCPCKKLIAVVPTILFFSLYIPLLFQLFILFPLFPPNIQTDTKKTNNLSIYTELW